MRSAHDKRLLRVEVPSSHCSRALFRSTSHSCSENKRGGSVPTEAGSCRCSGAIIRQELLQKQERRKIQDSVVNRSTGASANTGAPVGTGVTNQCIGL